VTVFVDTSAWYAIADSNDSNHRAAREGVIRLHRDRLDLVTHNYVLVETLALIQHRAGKAAARTFVTELAPIAVVEWIRPSLHEAAVASYLDSGRALSFVDHVSFALMRARGISAAFAFDTDFADRGFDLIGAL